LYVGVPIIPFNGQTTSNHTKLSMPSRSPLDFGVQVPLDMSNGSSRRAASDHQILPTVAARLAKTDSWWSLSFHSVLYLPRTTGAESHARQVHVGTRSTASPLPPTFSTTQETSAANVSRHSAGATSDDTMYFFAIAAVQPVLMPIGTPDDIPSLIGGLRIASPTCCSVGIMARISRKTK
jgi:hypothetical protein